MGNRESPGDSQLLGISSQQQVGWRGSSADELATVWSGSSNSWIDLNGPVFASSVASGVHDGRQVGWINVGTIMNVSRHAARWSGTSASVVDMHPPGKLFSLAAGIHGNEQVGWVKTSDGVTRASVWHDTAGSWTDLHPVNHSASLAFATDGSEQVGYSFPITGRRQTGFGATHASLWRGSAASHVNLNPVGISGSRAYAVHNGVQVGLVMIDGIRRPAIWHGTAASWVNLTPPGLIAGECNAVYDDWQAGAVWVGSESHASIWNGTPQSWVDLHAMLPAGYIESTATGIWRDGQTIYVAGWGYNILFARDTALLWVYQP